MKTIAITIIAFTVLGACSSKKGSQNASYRSSFLLENGLKYWPERDSTIDVSDIDMILDSLQKSYTLARLMRKDVYKANFPFSKPYVDSLIVENTTKEAFDEILTISGIEGFIDVDNKWQQQLEFLADRMFIVYRATLPPDKDQIMLKLTLNDSTREIIFKYDRVSTQWNTREISLLTFGIDSSKLYVDERPLALQTEIEVDNIEND